MKINIQINIDEDNDKNNLLDLIDKEINKAYSRQYTHDKASGCMRGLLKARNIIENYTFNK